METGHLTGGSWRREFQTKQTGWGNFSAFFPSGTLRDSVVLSCLIRGVSFVTAATTPFFLLLRST